MVHEPVFELLKKQRTNGPVMHYLVSILGETENSNITVSSITNISQKKLIYYISLQYLL